MPQERPAASLFIEESRLKETITMDACIHLHCHRLASICARVSLGVLSGDAGAIDTVRCWKQWLCCGSLKGSTADLGRILQLLAGPDDDGFPGERAERLATVNQILHLFWKTENTVSPDVVKKTKESFVKRIAQSGKPSLTLTQKERIRLELARVFDGCPDWERLKGRNGPGAVAEGTQGASRWVEFTRPGEVPSMFYRCSIDHWVQQGPVPVVKYGVTRALFVPKDVRGPRAISCEPLGFQHAQFGVATWMEKRIRSRLRDCVTLESQDRHCRFLNNQQWVTIDLSDASDYVSRRVVYDLFPRGLRARMFACRSTFTSVDGKLVPLRAFAPMGSSLCFVTMTALIACALRAFLSRPFSVYGDDIIVHRDDLPESLDVLQRLGLRVNANKTTSYLSRFRESCGNDYIWSDEGERCFASPVFLRVNPCSDRLSAVQLIRLGIGASRLHNLGFTCTAKLVIQQILTHNPSLGRTRLRWNPEYQRVEYLAWTLREQKTKEKGVILGGWPGLHRYYCIHTQWSTAVRSRRPHTAVARVWKPYPGVTRWCDSLIWCDNQVEDSEA